MEEVVRRLRDGVLHVHLVAADVPVLLGDGVLEVDVVVGRVQGRVDPSRDLRDSRASRHRADTVTCTGGDHRQALRVARVEELDVGRAVRALQLLQTLADACRHSHHVVADAAVARRAQSQKLVELDVDPRRRPRKVQRERVATRLGDEARLDDPARTAPTSTADATLKTNTGFGTCT